MALNIYDSNKNSSVPLNTLSSNQVMCESTFHYKSPIVLNQFPSLMNYTPDPAGNQTTQSTPLQIGSVIQGPQGLGNLENLEIASFDFVFFCFVSA